MKEPTCEFCKEKEATCFGSYEGTDNMAYACSDCCGHSCENGSCRLIRTDD